MCYAICTIGFQLLMLRLVSVVTTAIKGINLSDEEGRRAQGELGANWEKIFSTITSLHELHGFHKLLRSDLNHSPQYVMLMNEDTSTFYLLYKGL